MRGWTLGSGSSGNAIVLESDGHRILIDCGFGPRALVTRLAAVGITPDSISAILVTHEHVDHAQGVARVQHKYRWPVIATEGTLDAIGGIAARWRSPLATGTPTRVDGFEIEGFAIPHDAAAPAAFRITALASGARAGVAHDLGRVPEALLDGFRGLDWLFIEANHDEAMLRNGPYPYHLQERIRGGSGHLSNGECGHWAREIVDRETREVVLLHLSEQNNTPELAERSVREAVKGTSFRGTVRAAPRRVPTAMTGLGGSSSPPAQLSLGM